MQSENLLSSLSWIDITSMVLIAVFGVMGLVRGLVWQISRLASLVIGYIAAVRYAEDVAAWLINWFKIEDHALAVYIAYAVIFVAVLVLLSVITGLLRKLLHKSGLTFVDRMGGWLFGLVTGAAVIIVALTLIFAFAPKGSEIVHEVQASHSAKYAGRIVNKFDQYLPEDIRKLFEGWPHEETVLDREGNPVPAGHRRELEGPGWSPPKTNESSRKTESTRVEKR